MCFVHYRCYACYGASTLSISGLGLLLNVESSGDWYAIMLALSAAMVWAAGNVAMKGKLMGCDLTSLTAWQMTIGAVVLAVYNVFGVT